MKLRVTDLDPTEGKQKPGLFPRVSKVSSVPLLNLTPLNAVTKSQDLPKVQPNPKKKLFEEYRPLTDEQSNHSTPSPQEPKINFKQSHFATLHNKLQRSFEKNHETPKPEIANQSVSIIPKKEYEIDKLLLKPSHSTLHFPLKSVGMKGKTEGKSLRSLIHAVLSNLPRRVKLMLDNCGTFAEKMRMAVVVDQFGRSALHYASFLGYLPVCEKLLAAGALYFRRDHLGRTPLHYASIGGSDQVINLLTQQYHPVDKRENTHHHRTVSHPRPSIYEITTLSKSDLRDFAATLQEMNAFIMDAELPGFGLQQSDNYIDYQDQLGRTSLHYAVLTGSIRCIKILFSLGANLDILDCENRRPEDYAEHQSIRKFLKSRITMAIPKANAE